MSAGSVVGLAGGTSPPLMLLSVTHGSPSADNRAAIIALVDAVASARPRLDVAIGFVDTRNADVAAALSQHVGLPDAVIVPLVLSAGFHVRSGLAEGIERLELGGAVLANALGPDRRIVDVLADRLEEAGLLPGDSVLLAAAGSTDARAVAECFETGRLLAAGLGRPVTVGFAAAGSPRVHDAIEMLRAVHHGSRVVVSAYLLAPGVFYDTVRGIGADAVSAPLVLPGTVVPTALVDLVLDRYDAAAEGITLMLERTAPPDHRR